MWSLRAQSACISLVIMLGWKAVTHSRNVRGSVISVKRLAVSHLETPVINSESNCVESKWSQFQCPNNPAERKISYEK